MSFKKRILVCLLILALLIAIALGLMIFFTNQGDDDTTVDNDGNNEISDSVSNDDIANINYQIELQDTNLNKWLAEYLSEGLEVSIESVNNYIIQGDIHNVNLGGNLFVTEALFTYNFLTDEFNIYKYDSSSRILNYYITNDYIYAGLVEYYSMEDDIYNWSIVKYDKDFSNSNVLASGIISNPLNTPVFYYNDNVDKLYSITITDNYNRGVDTVSTSNLQTFNIYYIDGDNIYSIKDGTGDSQNNTGVMLCNMFDFQMYGDNLLYCTTDYSSAQEIKELNLSNNEEQTIYKNDLNSGLFINSFQRNDKGIYIGSTYIDNYSKGKVGFLTFADDVLKDIDSSVLYGRVPFIDGNMLFHSLENWQMYLTGINQIVDVEVIGDNKDKYLYPTFYVLDNETILVKSQNNTFYLGNILKNS